MCGRGFGGGPPKTPREWTLVHWYPPGGGGGPKKRHLVLYKLAGFCTADTPARRPFFGELCSCRFSKKSEICKKMSLLASKTPQKPPFWAYFDPFLAGFSPRNWGGRDAPFWGGPPRGPGGGTGREPPLGGGPGGAVGGVVKNPEDF